MTRKTGWVLVVIGIVLLFALLVYITDGIAQEEPGGSDIVPVFNERGMAVETVPAQSTPEFVPPTPTSIPPAPSELPPLLPPPDCLTCADMTPGPDGPPPLSTPLPPYALFDTTSQPLSQFNINTLLEFFTRLKHAFRKP